MRDARVSILVPAWNESSNIERSIKSFLALKYPSADLIVVAGGEDGTYDLAKKYEGKNVKVLQQEKKSKNRALNLALTRAKGEIIVLTDADCVMSDEWLAPLIEAMEKGEEAVSGTNMPLQEQLSNPFVLYQFAFTLADIDDIICSGEKNFLDGKNAAVRKELLTRLGGFDETALTGTDFSLRHQLSEVGVEVGYVMGSVIHTMYPSSVMEYISQQSRWLKNFAIYGRKYSNQEELKVFTEQTLIGSCILFLPVFAILYKPAFFLWIILFLSGIYNRSKLISKVKKMRPKLNFNSLYTKLPFYLLLEYFSHSMALLDYFIPTRRRKW